MRKSESGEKSGFQPLPVLFGGFLALGVAMLVLLLGAVAASGGILKGDAGLQVAAAACLIGCAVGAFFFCGGQVRQYALPSGLGVGAVCFALIVAVGLLLGEGPVLGLQAAVELAACLLGGGIVGMLRSKGKKKRKKAARRR